MLLHVPCVRACVHACRICRTFTEAMWGPTASEFYAIGNTWGYDLTAGLLPHGCPQARLLLAACGDVRSLLATVRCGTVRYGIV